MITSILKSAFLPWWGLFLPRRKGLHPYFGPFTRAYGGPDLKVRKLKQRFGNSYWPSHIYVVSGKPLSLAFLRLAKARGIPVLLNQNGVFYPAWYRGSVEAMNKQLF